MQDFHEHDIDWTDDKVERLWDYYSKTPPYNTIYFTSVYAYDILNIVKKHVNITDKVILDFGSGAGYLIDEVNLNYTPKTYYALDFSPDSVKIANNKNVPFDLHGILGGNFPSEIEDNSVDVCFFIEVIEHLNDNHLKSSLDEIYRVLKPNGILIITTPNNEDLNLNKLFCPDCGCKFHKWQHQRAWTKNTLQTTLEEFHFHSKEILEIDLKTKSKLKNIFRKMKSLYTKSGSKNLVGIFSK